MQSIIVSDNFTAIQFDSTLLRGSGVPPTSIGVNGDYYLDRVSGYLYHKSGNIWSTETNLKGDSGESAYTYIAYASDGNGSNFTLTFNDSLDYIAILNTTSKIHNPQVSDFIGLWKNYKGTETNNILVATSSEILIAGAFVNVYGDIGSYLVKNANAIDSNSPATGFVLSDYSIGSSVNVYLSGMNTALSSLVSETLYYLSTTGGEVTADAPHSEGNIIQQLGLAINSTTLDFDSQDYITVG